MGAGPARHVYTTRLAFGSKSGGISRKGGDGDGGGDLGHGGDLGGIDGGGADGGINETMANEDMPPPPVVFARVWAV